MSLVSWSNSIQKLHRLNAASHFCRVSCRCCTSWFLFSCWTGWDGWPSRIWCSSTAKIVKIFLRRTNNDNHTYGTGKHHTNEWKGDMFCGPSWEVHVLPQSVLRGPFEVQTTAWGFLFHVHCWIRMYVCSCGILWIVATMLSTIWLEWHFYIIPTLHVYNIY